MKPVFHIFFLFQPFREFLSSPKLYYSFFTEFIHKYILLNLI